MGDDKTSPEWSPEAVRRRLRKIASGGRDASAQVFFDDGVAAERLLDAAEKAITEAAARVGRAARVRIGRVHKLAKSVSVTGDPDVIAELAAVPPVRAVLPSEIEDVYPKPTRIEQLE